MKSNAGFQAFNIRRALAAAGIDPEKFDVHAHMDRTLTMRENIANIRGMTRGGSRSTRDTRPRKRAHAGGEYWQRGRTHEAIDKKRKAEIPGKRIRKGKKPYYERRKNRSDRPGWFI